MHASFLLYSFYLFLHSLPIVTESVRKSKRRLMGALQGRGMQEVESGLFCEASGRAL